MKAARGLSVLLIGMAIVACTQQSPQVVKPVATFQTVELPFGESAAGLRPQVSSVQQDSVIVFDPFNTTQAAAFGADSNFYYISRTFKFTNTTNGNLTNVSLYAYNQAANNKGGTAIKNLTNFVGGSTADTVNAQNLLPTHAMTGNGSVNIVLGSEDFQIYSDAGTVQNAARTALPAIIGANDSVLEYGFVARYCTADCTTNNPTWSRTIPAGQKGQVTVAYKIPVALGNSAYGFTATFVVATDDVVRVTRSSEETTAAAVSRATATSATEVVLAGQDSTTTTGAVRVLNAKIGVNPSFLLKNTNAACPALPSSTNFKSIPEIQGGALQSAFATNTGVTTEGLVVGDFQGVAPNLGGYFIQSTLDTDVNASEGLFIFDNTNAVDVGDYVRLTGTISEFKRTSPTAPADPSNITETQLISLTAFNKCQTGQTVTPIVLNFPLLNGQADLEKYEGMLVTIPQSLTVTEHFLLGRFGQIEVSSASAGSDNLAGTDARLDQFTQGNSPSVAGFAAYNTQLEKRRLIVDDGQVVSGPSASAPGQNPDPIKFGRGGNPLSASNTLRGGDTIVGLTGVIDQRLNGPINAAGVAADAADNTYRLQVTGTANFLPTNSRPTSPLNLPGMLRVVSMNVLNYFNDVGNNNTTTLTSPSYVCRSSDGYAAPSFTVRGAETAAEFIRQRNKTIAAIQALNADVIGLLEMENNGDTATSAIANLVSGLNAADGAGVWSYVQDPKNTGGVGNPGCDAIKVAMIYKTAKVSLVGNAYSLNTGAFGPFTLTGGVVQQRQRPALAQTFQQTSSSQQFTLVINHWKSKGSDCNSNVSPVATDPDMSDGQGNCNLTRKQAALDLKAWLATDPTGTTDPDYLLMGDFNSYSQEDPLVALTPTFASLLPDSEYSYVFDGQWGSLDHAFASSSLNSQVPSGGAIKYHNNADEPVLLDYNTNFKTTGQQASLYAADAYRASDHDPVVVGLNLGNASGFTLGATSPSASSFVSGTGGTATSTITPSRNSFNDPITFSLDVSPANAGITATFTNDPNSSGTSTMNLDVANSVAAGNYVLTVKGTSGVTVVSSNTLQVTVSPVCTGLVVSPSSANIAVGNTQNLTAAFTPNGCVPAVSTIVWSNGGSSIASVNSSTGVVTGNAGGGPINITATAGSLSGSSSITVNAGGGVVVVGGAGPSTNIMISEFRSRGPNGGNDEFIELYNSSNATLDLGGCTIRRSNANGIISLVATIPVGTSLQSGQYYLLTNSASQGYTGLVNGDQTYNSSFTDDGGIALLDKVSVVVDAVGMSSGSAYKEGTVLSPLTQSVNQSYKRKGQNSLQDTNNNNVDFEFFPSTSSPQNRASALFSPN